MLRQPLLILTALAVCAAVGCSVARGPRRVTAAAVPVERPADLQAFLDAAARSGARTVVIPPGEYRLAPPAPGRPHLTIAGARDLTIVADGVRLVCTSLDRAVYLSDCTNVTLRGLTVDYDPLPFTQGVVVAADAAGAWLDVRLDDGYPDVHGPNRRAIPYDPVTRRPKPGAWTRYGVTVTPRQYIRPGERVVRVESPRPIRDTVAVGDPISITLRTSTPHGLMVERGTRCTFENVTLHAATSFGFFERQGGGNAYVGCRVVPGEPPRGATAPRLLASNADAFHSKSTTRGPRVENCTLDAMGDDGVAINGEFVLVVSSDGENRATLSPHRAFPFEVGDRVHGISRDGLPTGDARIVAIDPVETDDPALAKDVQLKHYPNLRLADGLFKQSVAVTFDRPLGLAEGFLVASPDRNGSGFVVRDNVIRGTRARGVLVKASAGAIEGNTIEDIALAGIVLCPETRFWHEADYSTDVAIRANTLRRINTGAPNPGAIQAAAINVVAEGDGKHPGPAGGHRGIVIANNRVEATNGALIAVTSARDVTIRGNTFAETHAAPGGSGTAYGLDPKSVVWISHAEDVTIEDNALKNPGPHANVAAPVVATDTTNDIRGVASGVSVAPTRSAASD